LFAWVRYRRRRLLDLLGQIQGRAGAVERRGAAADGASRIARTVPAGAEFTRDTTHAGRQRDEGIGDRLELPNSRSLPMKQVSAPIPLLPDDEQIAAARHGSSPAPGSQQAFCRLPDRSHLS
jgi:hypothetical protein